ncbi:adenosylcobinamide-GDP ribazoletransferase [Tepidimonas charontis]|uniref:Adenosylcobinamide-GDP ribazoletransferase n=1 Tax=Tepidimonas charontis TaxID=2267262 RepID=A0A554XKY0_9BURK|nr:Adenosylcobinamide-GDP ribazoletransferase [Tepidimonas charontis]
MIVRGVRHFLLALQFFTRIPVRGRLAAWVGYSPAMLRASAAHFPGVGWVVGTWCGAVFALAIHIFGANAAGAALAAVLSTAAGVWLTGAFHEDGLADTADALGGHVSRERALEIMKDSRIGSYGTLAVLLALALKLALLVWLTQALGPLAVAWGLFGAHVTSRTAPLLTIATLPHIGDTATSKSKPLADRIGVAALGVAGLWCAAALAVLVWATPPAPWWAGVLGALLGWSWMWHLLRRRLGGFTGDTLGATQQLAELGWWLGLAMASALVGGGFA